MKNSTLNCLNSLCNFRFFKPDDLRKTSLNRQSKTQNEQTDFKQNSPELSGRYNLPVLRLSNRQDSKRELEVPSAKPEKEKCTVTEKDFRIMQVSDLNGVF